jgi:calcineurin-like phosphoesterase family protein
MKLRDDIDPAHTWLIADTHFGHKNIIGYCHRPANFEDILLEELSVIPAGDTLLHLGDLCYKGNAWFKNMIAPKIAPGTRKLLILGNHDHQRSAFYRQTGWHVTAPFYFAYGLTGGGPGVIDYAHEYVHGSDHIVSFSHYPWSADDRRGQLNWERGEIDQLHHRLHGHIHNNGYFDGRSTDVGDTLIPYLRNHTNLSCEMTKYKPVRLDLLLDAVLYGRLPQPPSTPSDGDAPSAADIGKASHHS